MVMRFLWQNIWCHKGLKIYLSRCDLKRTQVNTEIPRERRDKIEVFVPSYQPDNVYPDTECVMFLAKEFIDFTNRTYDDIIQKIY